MFSQKILSWFDKEKRELPWRNKTKNPYYTWLSEIMLQQTTVITVIPYFNNFIKKWPTLQDLAKASLDEILIKWQGLGYYSRARNLYQCALKLAQHFPSDENELLKLPGIGPYTAAAIASIAFNQKVAAVDGNVIRVMTRYLALSLPKPFQEVKTQLQSYLPEERCGDFTEALMELGALICRPKQPACQNCPLQKECKAYLLNSTDKFPLKVLKAKLPIRYTTAFIIKREDGAILIRKRPHRGLLGGMMEVPTTPWIEEKIGSSRIKVKHTFTHFHLEVSLSYLDSSSEFEGIWIHPKNLEKYALPTLMKKIIKAGLKELEQEQNSGGDEL